MSARRRKTANSGTIRVDWAARISAIFTVAGVVVALVIGAWQILLAMPGTTKPDGGGGGTQDGGGSSATQDGGGSTTTRNGGGGVADAPRRAVLYPTEAEAAQHCSSAGIVFANTRSRIYHDRSDSLYGIWGIGAYPSKGYGCAAQLLQAGYRKSLSR